ncbi:hypothetical protein [Parasphingopyxis sp.]|uniref:hypothetical protein n=1 Tax=Parasphingopyxis sp. TaxID=1920299 RepID=UPI00262E5442|nr:hypothetical protein [Parasphingopyxis sp.]
MSDYPIMWFVICIAACVCAVGVIIIAVKTAKSGQIIVPETTAIVELTEPSEAEIRNGMVYLTSYSGSQRVIRSMSIPHAMQTSARVQDAIEKWNAEQASVVAFDSRA